VKKLISQRHNDSGLIVKCFNWEDLPADKDAKIVVYCMMGPMGDIAAEKLANMGYTRVSNFQGGMMVWVQAGRHLQRRKRR